MLWTICVVLIVLWLLGFSIHIGGALIHLLLVVALIVLVVQLLTGRGPGSSPPSVRTSSSVTPAGRVSYGAIVGVVAVLYFAREVLIPLALATLFSFLLGPLVRRLERWRLRRAPAVLAIAAVFFGVFGLIAWLSVAQAMDLAGKLPGYQNNIQEKVEALRNRGGSLTAVATVLQNVEQKTAPPSLPVSCGPARRHGAIADGRAGHRATGPHADVAEWAARTLARPAHDDGPRRDLHGFHPPPAGESARPPLAPRRAGTPAADHAGGR